MVIKQLRHFLYQGSSLRSTIVSSYGKAKKIILQPLRALGNANRSSSDFLKFRRVRRIIFNLVHFNFRNRPLVGKRRHRDQSNMKALFPKLEHVRSTIIYEYNAEDLLYIELKFFFHDLP